MTRIEKAWYKRIFNPVNYCQYRVHNLKHNYVPVSCQLVLQMRTRRGIVHRKKPVNEFFINSFTGFFIYDVLYCCPDLHYLLSLLRKFIMMGPPQLALSVEMLGAFLCAEGPTPACVARRNAWCISTCWGPYSLVLAFLLVCRCFV